MIDQNTTLRSLKSQRPLVYAPQVKNDPRTNDAPTDHHNDRLHTHHEWRAILAQRTLRPIITTTACMGSTTTPKATNDPRPNNAPTDPPGRPRSSIISSDHRSPILQSWDRPIGDNNNILLLIIIIYYYQTTEFRIHSVNTVNFHYYYSIHGYRLPLQGNPKLLIQRIPRDTADSEWDRYPSSSAADSIRIPNF